MQRLSSLSADRGPLGDLFEPQLRVVRDPSKFRAMLVGRRGGKTITETRVFADAMLANKLPNLYIALSLDSAKRLLWNPLKDANEQHGWGFDFRVQDSTIAAPNGGTLLIRGADDVRAIEKLRGQPFWRIAIDECGSHRPSYLKYIIEDVLEASLMDFDGGMDLLGTPTRQAAGFWYDVTTGQLPGYSVHKWTARDNPHINFEHFVHGPEGLLARRNWTQDNHTFRREYLAEWTVDPSFLVYRFERERNVVAELPRLERGDEWVTVIGLDFGVADATACTVLRYPKRFGRGIYVCDFWKQTGLAPSEAADRVLETRKLWQPVNNLIGDIGGLGKAFQAEWNRRNPGVAMEAANKLDKRGTLEFVSDLLYTAKHAQTAKDTHGLMSLDRPEHAELHAEWATLQWNEERSDIADGQDDDGSDSCMYGVKRSPAFANAKVLPPDPPRNPFAGTAHEARWKAPQKVTHPGLKGAFGLSRFRR